MLTVGNVLTRAHNDRLIRSVMLKYIRTVLRIPHVAIRGITSWRTFACFDPCDEMVQEQSPVCLNYIRGAQKHVERI